MSFLQSLHFGIRTGSGLSRGNMTSSPPTLFLSSYFSLLVSFPPFVRPSPRLQIPCRLSRVPAVCVSVGCVCEWTLTYILVTSCVNKYM